MKQAFDRRQAHFEGMCPQPPPPDEKRLFVGDVLQKAMIDVQENGVEAAAATAVVMRFGMGLIANRPAPIPMVVNRPYLIAVLDVPTGAILMLGHITDPSQAPQ